MKIHKAVATTAAPFGPDMHQSVCRLRLWRDGTGDRRGGEEPPQAKAWPPALFSWRRLWCNAPSYGGAMSSCLPLIVRP